MADREHVVLDPRWTAAVLRASTGHVPDFAWVDSAAVTSLAQSATATKLALAMITDSADIERLSRASATFGRRFGIRGWWAAARLVVAACASEHDLAAVVRSWDGVKGAQRWVLYSCVLRSPLAGMDVVAAVPGPAIADNDRLYHGGRSRLRDALDARHGPGAAEAALGVAPGWPRPFGELCALVARSEPARPLAASVWALASAQLEPVSPGGWAIRPAVRRITQISARLAAADDDVLRTAECLINDGSGAAVLAVLDAAAGLVRKPSTGRAR